MSSIITNRSALQALQSMNAASTELVATQQRVATGLRVTGPRDNAAIYGIAQSMRAEVSGWEAANRSLNRGLSVLGVAVNGAQTISDLLIDLKTTAVAYADDSLGENSRSLLFEDMQALLRQINHVAGTSEFDGINLLSPVFDPPVSLPAPLVGPVADLSFSVPMAREPGLVTVDFTWLNAISFPEMHLEGAGLNDRASAQYGAGSTRYWSQDWSQTFRYGNWGDLDDVGPASLDFTFHAEPHPPLPDPPPPAPPLPPDPFGVIMEGLTFTPIRTKESVIGNAQGSAVDLKYRPLTTDWLELTNLASMSPRSILNLIDAAQAEVSSAASYFGGQQQALEASVAANRKLVDTLSSGIGNLVDADLAKESAKLQAQQVKQQLASQTLSIANREPQWILGLFKA